MTDISLCDPYFVYLHGGAIALMSISKPAVVCCTLVQVNALNVDIHTYNTSEMRKTHIKDANIIS